MAIKMYCDCCGKESKNLKFLYARAADSSGPMSNFFSAFIPLTGYKEFCDECIIKFERLIKAEIETTQNKI